MITMYRTTDKPSLFLNQMPFKDQVYHTMAGGSKGRALTCEFFDAADVLPAQADFLLEQIAGIEKIKALLVERDDRRVTLFREAVQAALARKNGTAPLLSATPARQNIVLVGPSGVGKTKMAQASGIYLAANKLVKVPKVALIRALDLRGEFVGETNVLVNKIMEFIRGGVLIIDEAGAISSCGDSTSFDKEAREQLNAVMETENKAGTTVILTGYATSIEALMSDQPGLRERFPQPHWVIDKYDDVQIRKVFDSKLKFEGLSIEPQAEDLAYKNLSLARDQLGDKFGNARTIERFVGMLIKEHSRQFPESDLERIKVGSLPSEKLLTLEMASVPLFDRQRQDFVKGGTRLMVVQHAQCAPA